MNTAIEQALPEQWRAPYQFVRIPVHWLFHAQGAMWSWMGNADIWQLIFFKYVFLFLPLFSASLGLCCAVLALYTLPFRARRVQFIVTMTISWWDFIRTAWLFWAGMCKFVFVAFGSFWGLLRLSVEVILEMIREMFALPFVLTGNMAKSFLQPGVPWIAFLLTVVWGAVEALVFTYVLTPTFSEVLSDLVGVESHRWLGVVLYGILFCMILGSFACMQVLVEAVRARNIKQILQMIIVEFFVMFVEVVFLYRELIDALTPWIAQQTGLQMGIIPVMTFAVFGWLGMRGMVWFLFGRFGTPTLLAMISRQRLPDEVASESAAVQNISDQHWERVLQRLKRDQEWFYQRAQALLEAAILPAFQVVAAGINFCVVLLLSRPAFNLPFKNLAEVGETKAILQSLALGQRES
ncbi:MAG TPA: hypothetical protein DEB40_10170 [Elusimicrobia bacterium]|nr:hypothetical protein [Elusimicrobiota bacterium]HBT62095.1 hypothetical protein [Elusimicrobiota bacterium]